MSEELTSLQSELDQSQDKMDAPFKEVQELGTLLIKTLKIFCIYPSDNPIPREFKNNLFKKLTEFLEVNQELKLGVDQSRFLFKDKTILAEEKKEEGISFALYRDGIREITFQKGTDQEELFSFLDIISCGLKSRLPEDDLVTLFWEKELSHIKLLVVDEFLNENLIDLPQPVGSKDLRELYYSEMDLGDKREIEKQIPTNLEIERFLRDLDLIPEKELEELRTLLEKDKNFEPLKEIFSILKEVIASEREFPEFLEMISLLEKLLDSLISQGDFYLASELILLLRELEKTYTEMGNAQRSERIRETLNRAGDKERMKTLTQILNQNQGSDLFSARKYLSFLNPNTIPHLVDMLGDLESFAARKMVCSILENVGEKNIDLLSKGIYDRRWYVVRNIVGVLGKIRSPHAIPYLKRTIAHEDLRVRKETLEALSLINGKEVNLILLNLLEDPEAKLRLRAAKILSQKPSQEAFDYFFGLLQRKDFKEKDLEEKKILLETWVKIGKDEAIPLLKKLIQKRSWVKREKQRETSLTALKALASIHTSLSLECLKDLSSKGDRKIREQARIFWEKHSSSLPPEELKAPAEETEI